MKTKEILEACIQIHDKKNADYTTDPNSNPKENFERASLIASWFTDEQDKVYATLIGIKLARIASLRSSNRAPNNESITDSFIDLTTYSALFGFSVTGSSESTPAPTTDLVNCFTCACGVDEKKAFKASTPDGSRGRFFCSQEHVDQFYKRYCEFCLYIIEPNQFKIKNHHAERFMHDTCHPLAPMWLKVQYDTPSLIHEGF